MGPGTTWRCVICNKHTTCLATVKQIGNIFKTGIQPHIHEPQPGVATACCIQKEDKATALSQIFGSAAEIADEVISEHINSDEPLPSLPAPANLEKLPITIDNITIQKMQSPLTFDVTEDFIPEGLFKKDVKVGICHHLIFTNDKMIELLSLAKNWFINTTFKAVKSPSTQLLSMHAFFKSGVSWKQVPLLFSLILGKCHCDYMKVLQAVIQLLPVNPAPVKTVIVGFEAAMWQAIFSVLPTTKILGCYFHWSWAVWRKVQALGLQSACRQQNPSSTSRSFSHWHTCHQSILSKS